MGSWTVERDADAVLVAFTGAGDGGVTSVMVGAACGCICQPSRKALPVRAMTAAAFKTTLKVFQKTPGFFNGAGRGIIGCTKRGRFVG